MRPASFPETTGIAGVEVTALARHCDARGWVLEIWRDDEGGDAHAPVMGYVSQTEPGVARGPHEHRLQSDLICFPGPGSFVVVLWDNRATSRDFGRRMRVEAGAEAPVAIRVPAGVVHAYRCVSPTPGLVVGLPDRLYRGPSRAEPVDEVRHEDDPESPFTVDFARMFAAERA